MRENLKINNDVSWKELSDGDRIRFEFEVQNSVSVTQFLPKDPTTVLGFCVCGKLADGCADATMRFSAPED
jgi:hypothetical protein